MHPRNKLVVLLAVNGILILLISHRFVQLNAAWDAWGLRTEMRQRLQKGKEKP